MTQAARTRAPTPQPREHPMHLFEQWRSRIPTPCPHCQADSRGARLCPDCRLALRVCMTDGTPRCSCCAVRLGTRQQCPDCTTRRPAFHRVIVGCDYATPGDALIRQFKAARQWQMAPALAALLVEAIQTHAEPLPRHAVLVPIPAHAASIRQRGFNPAAELARALAQPLRMRCEPAWLLRQHEGARQTHAARPQRLDAARHDFVCPAIPQDSIIALVDDVMTTGSTLHHAARALRRAGAAQVWGLALARTPLPHDA